MIAGHCGGHPTVELDAVRFHAPGDEITRGCGAELSIPADREERLTWDVRTEVTNHIEFVVERSIALRCQVCGYEGDENRIVEQLEQPVPFVDYEPQMEWARALRLNELTQVTR